MSIEQQIDLEQQIEANKQLIAAGKAFARLRGNKDFKNLILKGYFQDESVRLVHLRGAPEMDTPEAQEKILKNIDAVGAFAAYLRVIELNAAKASESIQDAQIELESLLGDDE